MKRVWFDQAVTHTAAEAMQNCDIVRGVEPPKILLPLMFETAQPTELPGRPKEFLGSIDTHLIEVSDLKVVRIGEWVVQVNLLLRTLVQKHPAALFQWYKELTMQGRASPETVSKAINKLSEYGRSDLDQLKDVLRFARLERTSQDQLNSEVAQLVSSAPGRWIFVSHFVVPGDDGAVMADRKLLIEGLRYATEAVGAELFDPSRLIEVHGRDTALAGGGADIFEYADPFNAVVGQAYLDMLVCGNSAGSALSAFDRQTGWSDLDKELVKIHRNRLNKLGSDAAGLFAHYEAAIANGVFLSDYERERLSYLIDFVTRFDRYIDFRAGLGEFGFALALSGRPVTLWDPNPARRRGLRDGLDVLCRKWPHLRELVSLPECQLHEIPIEPMERTLGLAFTLLLLNPNSDENDVGKAVARTDALLIYSPRHFLRSRDEHSAEDEVRDFLRKHGYVAVKPIPQYRLLLADRTSSAAG